MIPSSLRMVGLKNTAGAFFTFMAFIVIVWLLIPAYLLRLNLSLNVTAIKYWAKPRLSVQHYAAASVGCGIIPIEYDSICVGWRSLLER